jgi:hypothetical protein
MLYKESGMASHSGQDSRRACVTGARVTMSRSHLGVYI